MLPDLISCARQCVSLLLTICGLESRLYYEIFGNMKHQSLQLSGLESGEGSSIQRTYTDYQAKLDDGENSGEKLLDMFENLWELVSSALRPLFIRQVVTMT